MTTIPSITTLPKLTPLHKIAKALSSDSAKKILVGAIVVVVFPLVREAISRKFNETDTEEVTE